MVEPPSSHELEDLQRINSLATPGLHPGLNRLLLALAGVLVTVSLARKNF